jgi:serine/threonine protein kinase
MVGSFGQVYVMDWGMARLLDVVSEVTVGRDKRQSLDEHGQPVGTPAYMSPEQAYGLHLRRAMVIASLRRDMVVASLRWVTVGYRLCREGGCGADTVRVPCVLVSPFARRGVVSHAEYDHTSILRLIDWRWGLNALVDARRAGGDHRGGVGFRSPDPGAPEIVVPEISTALPVRSDPGTLGP